MSDEGQFSMCERCEEVIDPGANDTVSAHQQQQIRTADGIEYLEGQRVLYHAGCYPGDSRSLKRERPA